MDSQCVDAVAAAVMIGRPQTLWCRPPGADLTGQRRSPAAKAQTSGCRPRVADPRLQTWLPIGGDVSHRVPPVLAHPRLRGPNTPVLAHPRLRGPNTEEGPAVYLLFWRTPHVRGSKSSVATPKYHVRARLGPGGMQDVLFALDGGSGRWAVAPRQDPRQSDNTDVFWQKVTHAHIRAHQ